MVGLRLDLGDLNRGSTCHFYTLDKIPRRKLKALDIDNGTLTHRISEPMKSRQGFGLKSEDNSLFLKTTARGLSNLPLSGVLVKLENGRHDTGDSFPFGERPRVTQAA